MFFGKKRYENFDPSVETMREKNSFNVYPVKRKWLKKKLKDKGTKEQVVEPGFINPYFSTKYNQTFYLCDFAEFKKSINLVGNTTSTKKLRQTSISDFLKSLYKLKQKTKK
jgi:hypothetical protein